jgi:hypothetical protein
VKLSDELNTQFTIKSTEKIIKSTQANQTVIIEKSRGGGSLMEQVTIENVS